MPQSFQNAAACSEAIVDRVGRHIRLAIPVGIGKPNLLVNALYARAKSDPKLRLEIFTGLTLVRPSYAHDLERRFVAPLLDRLFASYPDLAYAEDIRSKRLPPNVEVHEFFLQAGAWINSDEAQRNFVSLNYVDVARHLQRLNVNVLGQLVAPDPSGNRENLSLSSNTDVALDMRGFIAAQRQRKRPIALAAEINDNLPYMLGEALRPMTDFDVVLEPSRPHFDLFAPPKLPVSLTDYATALRVAALIKDGGTLQIGIGTFGDALTHALILRHTKNDVFRDLISRLGMPKSLPPELEPFHQGLYGCTEMLVDGFLTLREAGILRRKVTRHATDAKPAVVHAAFFLGNRSFYKKLRELPDDGREEIGMTAVSHTNSLLGQEQARRQQRRDARFVNSGMVATLLGAVTSDQLENGRVISGIGGQNDFVAMANNMRGARSILALRSTRSRGGRTSSNIVWSFAHTSIPRQLRDVIATEYGLADLRGKSDRDVIVAMLAVADSDFQKRLCKKATRTGKIEPGLALDKSVANNRPERIEAELGEARRAGHLPLFPLGSEMTDIEQTIAETLQWLRDADIATKARAMMSGMDPRRPPTTCEMAVLGRMGLSKPRSMKERALQRVLLGALRSCPQSTPHEGSA